MRLALTWVAVLTGPTVVTAVALFGWRVLRRRGPALRAWTCRDLARPKGPPIERIAADLRRLRRELVVLETGSRPGKALRLRAVSMAYDDALRAACVALEVPGAGDLVAAPRAAHGQVVQTLEVRLAAAGLTVEPVGHPD